MSVLHIAVTGANEETQRRALEALQAAGIDVYRAWLEDPGKGQLNVIPDSPQVAEEIRRLRRGY